MTNKNEDEFPVLMERRLKYQPASGGELIDVTVEIGYPKWIEPNFTASCPVAFRGDIGRIKDIHGVDPINAMKHAVLFVESYLNPIDGKGKFFWDDGSGYTEG